MILVDAHVHIYDCYDVEKFFDSTYSNFRSRAERIGCGKKFISVLLLSETSRDHWFQQLTDFAVGKSLPGKKKTGTWTFHKTEEDCSLYGRSTNSKSLFLIAGQQVVTLEGLEVLALCTIKRFADGTPINKLIESINKVDGIPVLPWGFGKWIGGRGKLVRSLVANAQEHSFFLGDNGGRPFSLFKPYIFRLARTKGIKILPGSDPLPMASEQKRVGSFGLSFDEALSKKHPAQDLKQCLAGPMTRHRTFGQLENPLRFLRNQLVLRLNRTC